MQSVNKKNINKVTRRDVVRARQSKKFLNNSESGRFCLLPVTEQQLRKGKYSTLGKGINILSMNDKYLKPDWLEFISSKSSFKERNKAISLSVARRNQTTEAINNLSLRSPQHRVSVNTYLITFSSSNNENEDVTKTRAKVKQAIEASKGIIFCGYIDNKLFEIEQLNQVLDPIILKGNHRLDYLNPRRSELFTIADSNRIALNTKV
jgi:hypothetical protein